MNVDSLMIDEISELYKSVGWTHYTKDTARLARAFEQSESLVKRNGEEKIIGVVRWITDLRRSHLFKISSFIRGISAKE